VFLDLVIVETEAHVERIEECRGQIHERAERYPADNHITVVRRKRSADRQARGIRRNQAAIAEEVKAPWTARELGLLLGLGVIPTVLGHGSINCALKRLRGQVVGVANLGQVISAGLLAYLFLDEVPHPSFFPASFLIALGVWLVFRKRRASELPVR
jgi:hypothetical protein